jgi:hypothetical protein
MPCGAHAAATLLFAAAVDHRYETRRGLDWMEWPVSVGPSNPLPIIGVVPKLTAAAWLLAGCSCLGMDKLG